MNNKDFLLEDGIEQKQEGQAAHRKVYGTVIAAVVCLLLAIATWICVMNTQDTDYIPIRVVAPEGYTCELSVDGVEVKGSVAALRNMDVIEIKLSAEELASFNVEKQIGAEILDLPEGVRLVEEWNASLTVKEK